MKIRKQIRQGDILLCPIDKFPTGLKTKDKILAYGEATGHHHRFEENDESVIVKISDSGTQYIQVLKPSELKHEEHGNIQVDEGKYVLRRQREYDITSDVGEEAHQNVRDVVD